MEQLCEESFSFRSANLSVVFGLEVQSGCSSSDLQEHSGQKQGSDLEERMVSVPEKQNFPGNSYMFSSC